MWKIVCKNILALYRYCDFRVGIFYFASPCIQADAAITKLRSSTATKMRKAKRLLTSYRVCAGLAACCAQLSAKMLKQRKRASPCVKVLDAHQYFVV